MTMVFNKVLFPKVHRGLVIISWATGIRWIAWGLVDGIIAIYLFSFVGSYANTGVLTSVYSLVFVMVVPVVGVMANRVRAKNLILTGLLIYPFIGLSYYLAGIWGAVIFVVIARALNGVSYALDNVGRTTYLRKHHNKEVVGSAFGYMETLSNFWWLVALLSSAVVISYVEMHEMFLFIIPTSLVAFWLVTKVPKDPRDNKDVRWWNYLSFKAYKNFLQEIILWNKRLKKIAVLLFILGAVTSAVSFFMPIVLFHHSGLSLLEVILFVFVSSVPVLFSNAFGWLADTIKPTYLTLSFLLLAVLLVLLGLATSFSLQLLFVFLFMAVSTFISIFIDVEMTRRGDERKYGTLTSASLEVGELSGIVGPILIGFFIDIYSVQVAFIFIAILVALMAIVLRPVHKELLV